MSMRNYLKPVACLSPRATVLEASREMRSKGIGAVVVISDDSKPIGLVTDRDITMRVVAEQRSPEQTPLEQVMTSNVAVVSEDATPRGATELMRDKGVRRVPIVDGDGKIIGLVALDDLLVLLGMELGNIAAAIVAELSRSAEQEAAAWSPPT